MVQGRQNVRFDPKRSRIRPTATPKDMFAPKAQRKFRSPSEVDNNWESVANTLENLQPTVRKLAQGWANNYAESKASEARNVISKMTLEESKAAIENGELDELNDPYFNAAFSKLQGQRAGRERKHQIETDYLQNPQSFSGDNSLREHVRESIDQDLSVSENPYYSEGYNETMVSEVQDIFDAQREYQTEKKIRDARDSIFQNFLGTAREGLADGLSAGEIQTEIRSQYQGNEDMLGIPKADQDKMLLAATQQFAQEGQVELVTELLSSPRGSNGEIPPISAKRGLAADATRVIAVAKRVRADSNATSTTNAQVTWGVRAAQGELDEDAFAAWREKNPGAISEARARSLMEQSRLRKVQQADRAREDQLEANERIAKAEVLGEAFQKSQNGGIYELEDTTVTTADGNEVTVSAEEQEEYAITSYFESVDQAAEENDWTPEQTFDRKLSFAQANGIEIEQWTDTMESGFASASSNNVDTAEGNVPPALERGVSIYLKMHSEAPQLLQRHALDTQTQEFYEAYRVGTQDAGLTHDQALQSAAEYMKDPSKFNNAAVESRKSKIRDALSKYNPTDSWIPFASESIDNEGYMQQEIERLADFYTSVGGIGWEKALERGGEQFERTHTVVNNQIISVDREMPSDFPRLAEEKIRRWVRDTGNKFGYEMSDLTIKPVGNQAGTYTIVSKIDQMQPNIKVPETTVFGTGDLNKIRADLEEASLKRRVDEENQETDMRSTNIVAP